MSTPTPTPFLELLEKATPGPWYMEPHPADRTVHVYGPLPAQRLVAELYPASQFGQMECDANAELIALCSPTTMRLVYEALKLTVKEVECYCCSEGVANRQPCSHCRATAALNALNGGTT